MIGYLKGTVAASDGQIVTLMVGGVGFEVMMPCGEETPSICMALFGPMPETPMSTLKSFFSSALEKP